MHANMDPGVFMRIDGKMAHLLLEIDPEMYQPYVKYEQGQAVIYVELLKALYGTLRAAGLFWECLSSQLQEWGYVINPYDSCVANKVINGKQCTITWHVNNLKISHVDEQVVHEIISQLRNEFGQQVDLSTSFGQKQDYLGMELDFSTPGSLVIDMQTNIHNILADAPSELRGKSAVPAAKHLFQVRDDAPKLTPQQQEIFHHIVMQLMYLSQRARLDIETAVAFLSSHVQDPDQDDYNKLGKVLKYLESTLTLVLRLKMDPDGIL